MSTPNWANLVKQGRAKDIGVPWSLEEQNAVFVLKVPVEYVRRGCFTIEDYEALKKQDETHKSKTGELPVAAMPREDLLKKANEANLEITNDVADSALRALLAPFAAKAKSVKKAVAKKATTKKTKK